MTKEEFVDARLIVGEEVLYKGSRARIITITDHSLTLMLGPTSYITVMPVEVEMMDVRGVQLR